MRFAVLAVFLNGRGRHAIEESSELVDGHDHQIVQAEAGQCFELFACPLHAFGQEAFFFGQCGVGILRAAYAPQKAVCFKSGATARTAFGVAAVFGQEHADVHLVGFAFEVGKEAMHAIPLLVPLAIPVGGSFNHPLLLFFGELEPRCVARYARCFCVAHQIILRFFPRRCLNGFDGTRSEGEFFIRNDQPKVNTNHPPKTPTSFASAHRRVERKHRRHWLGIPQIAFGAVQSRREPPHVSSIAYGARS